MARVGLYFPGEQELQIYRNDGTWHRFKPVQSQWKRGKEAWYRIYEHQLKSGRMVYAGCFGIAGEKYLIEQEPRKWSEAEWKEIQSRRSEDEQQIEQAILERHKQAAEKALQMIESASSSVSPEHPYVKAKKIVPVGAKQLGDKILLPLWREKRLRGLQQIFSSKDEETGKDVILKIFLAGSDIKGSYTLLGKLPEKPDVVFVVEGWATGCTVYEATQKPVFVAFNAGNIYPVVESIRKHFPEVKICIAADNDCRYEKRLKAQVKEKYGIDLKTSASAKDAETQTAELPDGKVEVKAYWSKVDGATALIYVCKPPKQEKPTKVTYQNTGEVKAKRAAFKFAACVLLPRFKNADSFGTDFNDLASEEGLEVVKEQLNWQNAQPLEPPQPPSTQKFPDGQKKKDNSEVIKYLGDRYVAIDSTDTLWDVEQQRIVKISTVKQWHEASTVAAWLRDAFHNRRIIQPEQLIFEPDPAKIPPGCISTFSGWPLKPKPGNCDLIKDHLMKICADNSDIYDWVVKWLAYPLQHPGAKMQTALVVYGEREGTGKSLFFEVMKRIYGKYACSVNQAAMSSDFNGWISRRLFVVAEEVITSADRRHQKGGLKNLVTNHQHIINEKGLPIRFEVNKTNLVFLSNELPPLALDQFDRRYMAIKFNEPSSHDYFAQLVNEMDHGGVEAFYDFLLHYDLEDFCESTAIIDTDAHQELKLLSGDSMPRFLEHWLAGDTPFPVGPVVIKHLYKAYKMWAISAGERFNTSMDFMCKRLRTVMLARRMRVTLYTEDTINDMMRNQEEKQYTVYFPGFGPKQLKEALELYDVDVSLSCRTFQDELRKAERRFKNNETL